MMSFVVKADIYNNVDKTSRQHLARNLKKADLRRGGLK